MSIANGMPKPRLLFLCQTLPFPPDSGVALRSYHVLRLLCRDFRVHALCFFRSADRPNQEARRAAVEHLSEFCEVSAFPIPQEGSSVRMIADHLGSLLQGRSVNHNIYRSTEFGRAVRRLLADHDYSIIHVDSIDLVRYIPVSPYPPVVLVHHNVESSLLERRADAEANPLLARYIRHQVRLVEADERNFVPRVALNVCVSEHDAHSLGNLAPDSHRIVVPNGVDPAYFRPEPSNDRAGVVFVGGSTWFPNRDALHFFVTEILPGVRDAIPDLRVRWVGRAAPGDEDSFMRDYGVELTGYVADERPFIRDAACYVVPLRVGGGTRLKILVAWAMGKAVVSTSVGCEGLDAVDGENILIRDDPRELASAVAGVLRDEELRTKLGRNARRTVETSYSWDVIGKKMLNSYQALASEDSPT